VSANLLIQFAIGLASIQLFNDVEKFSQLIHILTLPSRTVFNILNERLDGMESPHFATPLF
jgi:hypothetical protein